MRLEATWSPNCFQRAQLDRGYTTATSPKYTVLYVLLRRRYVPCENRARGERGERDSCHAARRVLRSRAFEPSRDQRFLRLYTRCTRNAIVYPVSDSGQGTLSPMPKRAIVVHYHELWLKGQNRNFFLGKFLLALRRTLAHFPVERIRQPGDRVVIHLAEDTPRRAGGRGARARHGHRLLRRGPRRRTRLGQRSRRALPSGMGGDRAAGVFEFCRARQAQRQILSPAHFGDRSARGPLSARPLARGRPRGAREARRSRADLPHRNHARTDAGLRAKNSWPRRPAGEHHRPHALPALRRIRFGGGGLQDDAARRAHELRALLGRRSAPGRIVGARRARAGRAAGALPIHREALPRAFRADPAGDRAAARPKAIACCSIAG